MRPLPVVPVVLRLATADDRPVVERLWQLYAHDLSELRGSMPDAEGLFKPGRLPLYFEEPDRCVYVLSRDDVPAGFAMVRGLREGPRVMGEFFVVRAARRQGAGHDAAVQLLDRHPGPWEIAFQEENAGAARFWRRVAREAAARGGSWREERRPVPGKPEVQPDTWLLLDTGR